MNAPQFAAERGQLPKRFSIVRIRHARKIYFQKFLIRLAVGRAVQDGVDIIEQVYRREGVFRVLFLIGKRQP